jgi:hypothetical protein
MFLECQLVMGFLGTGLCEVDVCGMSGEPLATAPVSKLDRAEKARTFQSYQELRQGAEPHVPALLCCPVIG